MHSFLAFIDKKGYNNHDAMGIWAFACLLAVSPIAYTQFNRG